MNKLETAHDLQTRLSVILQTVEREFSPLTAEQLRWQPTANRPSPGWSIVECLQHLNLAERYYIRNLQHKVDGLGLLQTQPADQVLASDWVGKVMLHIVDPQVKMKLPAPGIIRPRPVADLDPIVVMGQFNELQNLLHTLLDKAVYLDWNREKVASLFGQWLKIRLGDTFRMLVAHTERHLNQALRAKTEMAALADSTH